MAAPDAAGVTEFHLATPHAVNALGRVAIVAGVGVVAVVVCTASLGPGLVRDVALALSWTVAAAGAVLIVVAAVRTVRPPVLVRLDDQGVWVRVLRGGGPVSIPWRAVRTVRRESLTPGPCVVVERADGRRTVLPERLVAEGGMALAAALAARLDGAHGQRRLGRDSETGDGGGGGI